jgi:hypothetical protein
MPQKPRTDLEEKEFRNDLKALHAVVIATDMRVCWIEHGLDRGWCVFEVQIKKQTIRSTYIISWVLYLGIVWMTAIIALLNTYVSVWFLLLIPKALYLISIGRAERLWADPYKGLYGAGEKIQSAEWSSNLQFTEKSDRQLVERLYTNYKSKKYRYWIFLNLLFAEMYIPISIFHSRSLNPYNWFGLQDIINYCYSGHLRKQKRKGLGVLFACKCGYFKNVSFGYTPYAYKEEIIYFDQMNHQCKIYKQHTCHCGTKRIAFNQEKERMWALCDSCGCFTNSFYYCPRCECIDHEYHTRDGSREQHDGFKAV